jgi:flagellar biosynthetic protein FliR
VNGFELAIDQSLIAGYILALARTAGFVLISPPFASRGVPARARAAIALGLALPLSVWTTPTAAPLASPELLGQIILQIFSGVAFGFVIYLAVAAMQAVGDLIDLVGGFNMAQSMDPLTMVQISVMGRLHQLVGLTLLVATDGHLMIVQGLSRSVQVMPQPTLDLEVLAATFTEQTSALFLAAVQVAGPVIAVMFVADVVLGLLTRAAPALNAFALGFPLKILLTLLLVGVLLSQLPDLLSGNVEHAVVTVIDLAGG